MAISLSFLNAVNESLTRAGIVAGDAGAITSFTDSARQRAVDIHVMIWQEVIDQLFSEGALQGEVATGTITLVDDSSASTRTEYDLPSDFLQFTGKERETRVMVNAGDNNRLYEYPGGYEKMFADQPDPTDFSGQPHFWVINKDNLKFRLDTMPGASESGDEYSFLYDQSVSFSAVDDTFPFDDAIVRSLVAAVADLSRLPLIERSVESIVASAGYIRALKLLRQIKPATSYGLRRVESYPQVL